MRSQKTTYSSMLAAAGAALVLVPEALDRAPTVQELAQGAAQAANHENPTLQLIGAAVFLIATLMQGRFTRDDDTTSEGGKIPQARR